jgi:predicted RNase H-like HicB family nuclease
MKTRNYIALFEQDSETGKYGVIVPDIPGFSSVGKDYDDAVRNATEGLASHIEVMRDYGEEVASPRTLPEIKKEWDGWADWEHRAGIKIGLIPVVLPFGTQRVLISLDVGLLARIDRIAKNRSAFLASAAEYMLSYDNNRYDKTM